MRQRRIHLETQFVEIHAGRGNFILVSHATSIPRCLSDLISLSPTGVVVASSTFACPSLTQSAQRTGVLKNVIFCDAPHRQRQGCGGNYFCWLEDGWRAHRPGESGSCIATRHDPSLSGSRRLLQPEAALRDEMQSGFVALVGNVGIGSGPAQSPGDGGSAGSLTFQNRTISPPVPEDSALIIWYAERFVCDVEPCPTSGRVARAAQELLTRVLRRLSAGSS